MLITHLGLTRDPPQKWFPFLHTRGQRSYTAQQSVFYRLKHHQLSDSPVSEAHCPRRVPGNPVHDTQPRWLQAVLPLPALTKLHLLCVHKKVTYYCKNTWEGLLWTSRWCFIFIQKLTYGFSHGHFLSSCLETTRNRWIVTTQCIKLLWGSQNRRRKRSYVPHCLMAQ